jgi:hypothetical protein
MKYLELFDNFVDNSIQEASIVGKEDLFNFVRYGGLDLKRQKGYSSEPAERGDWSRFHEPPTSRGFYAFPKIFQDWFLLSDMEIFQPDTLSKKDGSKTAFKKSMGLIRKEFRKDKGTVWHHLGPFAPKDKILDQHGSWVKTDIKTWARALSKRINWWRTRGAKSVNEPKGRSGLIGNIHSKAELEVFFDEKV